MELKLIRMRKGLSQKEAAKLCGVTNLTMCRLEKGRYYPDFKTAVRMSQVFDTPIEELFPEAWEEIRKERMKSE